jgi:hypothetical protein
MQLELTLTQPAEPDSGRPFGPAWDYEQGTRPGDYDLGHCWHYFMGGIPIPVECITPYRDWKPIKPIKAKGLDILIEAAKRELAADIARYKALAFGEHQDLLTQPAWGMALKLRLGNAIGSKHNHVSYHKGQLIYLRKLKHEFQQNQKRRPKRAAAKPTATLPAQ